MKLYSICRHTPGDVWRFGKGGRLALVVCAMGILASCVQVTAPDKPIVIDLNINIKQEVVYRLDNKAQELIQNQTEIF